MNFHEEFLDVRLVHFLQSRPNALFVERRRNRIGRLRKSAVGQMFVTFGVRLDFDAVHRFRQRGQGAIELIELSDDRRGNLRLLETLFEGVKLFE